MLILILQKSPFDTKEKYPVFQSSFNFAFAIFRMHSISDYTFRWKIFSDIVDPKLY